MTVYMQYDICERCVNMQNKLTLMKEIQMTDE